LGTQLSSKLCFAVRFAILNPQSSILHPRFAGVEGYRALVEKKQRPMLVAEYRAQAAGEITVVDLALPPSSLEPASNAAASNPPFIPIVNPLPAPTPAVPVSTPPQVNPTEEPEP
jgi:hypothetical protein